MRELLPGEVLWLGGGLLFACLIYALAQVAAFVPAPSWLTPTHNKRQCRRSAIKASRYPRVFPVCLGLLLIVLPAVLAADITASAAPAWAVAAGSLVGLWLSRRVDWRLHARAVTAAPCLAGMTALSIGVGGFLTWQAQLQSRPGLRLALFSAVTMGATLLGAAASARFGARLRGARAPLTTGDRAVHGIALLLCLVLGHGFIASDTSMELHLSMLGAAGLLGAALGVRLMSGVSALRASQRARLMLTPHGEANRPAASAVSPMPGCESVREQKRVDARASDILAPGCLHCRPDFFDMPARNSHYGRHNTLWRRCCRNCVLLRR
jgi:hypothetical protein